MTKKIDDGQKIHLLPIGEGKLVKRTKRGFYIKFPNQPIIYINYSKTLDERIFDEVDDGD